MIHSLESESESRSVMSNSLQLHGLYSPLEFSRPEYWSGYPFPSPGDLPNLGIKPRSPALQAGSLSAKPQGKPERKAEARCNSNAVTWIHSPTKYLVVSFCDDEAQGKHHSKMCCSGMWIIFSWKQAGSESSLCPIASKYLFTQHYLPEITLLDRKSVV